MCVCVCVCTCVQVNKRTQMLSKQYRLTRLYNVHAEFKVQLTTVYQDVCTVGSRLSEQAGAGGCSDN